MTKNKKDDRNSPAVYVIAGKEDTLVNENCRKLIDQLIPLEQRATGLLKKDGANTDIAEILDELRTLPFLTKKRVVVINQADKFITENRPALEKYFDKPSPTGILVMTAASFPATTKLAKKLKSMGTLIKVTPLKRWQLPSHLAQYTREKHAKNLTKPAAEFLVELSGDDVTRLYTEVDKLALFVEPQKTITPDHVEALTGRNRLYNVFAVIDAITAGKTALAVTRLRQLFASDKSAEFTAIGAFAFHFRRMFKAKAMIENGANTAQIASALKIWGDKEAFFSQLRRMKIKQIGQILQQLAETDHAIKTGRTKPNIAIETLVLTLAKK